MNLLFIGYWGASEGLSVATIYPHLQILSDSSKVTNIIYTSIERNGSTNVKLSIPKVIHIPLTSGNKLKDKFSDFWYFPKELIKICSTYKIDAIICRGAPAGSLGFLVNKETKIPFYVESFEPHAQYMLESNVWKKYDLRYLLQKYWENKQKKTASGLMPVAANYSKKLIKEGINSQKIKIVPCIVNLEKFSFNKEKRITTRTHLGIAAKSIVGVYVGKYGGLYLDKQAFQIYMQAFNFWQDFRLIILSPIFHHAYIYSQIKLFDLPQEKIYVTEAPHEQVVNYLSASDFAFATYKPGKSKKFLSPIKVGEYWANGLPVLLTNGVGDESTIIKEEGGGTLINVNEANNFQSSFLSISNLIGEKNHRLQIIQLAKKYRSIEKVKESYKDLLKL